MDDTAARLKGGSPPRPDRPGDDIAGREPESMRGYATDIPPGAGTAGTAPPFGAQPVERERSREAPAGDADTGRIRADIERTREEMAETIDAIQEKLRPGNLIAGARDRVRNSATSKIRSLAGSAGEGAQAMMQHTRARTGSLTERAGQNPIPVALIGIGAAWLLWNQTRSGRQRQKRTDRDWPVRYREAVGYEGFDEAGLGDAAYLAYDYDTDLDADLSEDYAWSRESRWGSGVARRVTEHPVPTALACAGLAWLAFAGDEGRGRFDRGAPRHSGADDRYPFAGGASGEQGSPQSLAGRAGESAAGMAERAQEATRQAAERARSYARSATRRVRTGGRRGQSGLQRLLQRNPLMAGAGAFVLGATVGLLLPETERENEWMGDARDRMLERAQERARDAARNVTATAKEAAGEAVGKLATEVTGSSPENPGPVRTSSRS